MFRHTKYIFIAVIGFGALVFTGCDRGSGSSLSVNEETGTVIVKARTSKVNTLGKSAAITLDSLIITAISNASLPDTVRVAVLAGQGGFSANAFSQQDVIVALENLKALRSWTIYSETKQGGLVIQQGQVAVNGLKLGEVREVDLTTDPVVIRYESTFNFPEFITSATGSDSQAVSVTKVQMLVDNNLVVDSNSIAFPTLTNDVSIVYDYAPVTTDSLTLKVYGYLEGASAPYDGEILLWSKTMAASALSVGEVNERPMDWVGPDGGGAEMTAKIGAVQVIQVSSPTPSETP